MSGAQSDTCMSVSFVKPRLLAARRRARAVVSLLVFVNKPTFCWGGGNIATTCDGGFGDAYLHTCAFSCCAFAIVRFPLGT